MDRIDYTIVAGADLTGQQFKFIGATGVLATSETNPVGVLQGKPNAGEHAGYAMFGRSSIYCTVSLGAGSFIGQSNVTSGGAAIVASGGFAFGRAITDGASGGIGQAILFGAPIYIAK